MILYEKLKQEKKNGKRLDFNELSIKQLRRLFIDEKVSDRLIGELFEVSKSKVSYRRTKHGITLRNVNIEKMFSGDKIFDQINNDSKNYLWQGENINKITTAITRFILKNETIDSICASSDNGMSNENMKELHQFTANRLSYIFTLLIEEKWAELSFLIDDIDNSNDRQVDEVVIDDGGYRNQLKILLGGK